MPSRNRTSTKKSSKASKKAAKKQDSKAATINAATSLAPSADGANNNAIAAAANAATTGATAATTTAVVPQIQPTIGHVALLPYVSELQPPVELHQLLLEEHGINATLQQASDHLDAVKKDKKNLEHDLELPRRTLQAAQNAADECRERTNRAIDKHYRKLSVKLHPDRNGEQYRPAFERLTEARNCLRDPKSRRLYLEQMLAVVTMRAKDGKSIGRDFARSSHEAWVARNDPESFHDDDQDEKKKREEAAGTSQRPLALQGGIYNDTPRKPRIRVLSVEKRRIEISLPLPDNDYTYHQFQQYCQRMVVLADSGFLEEELVLASLGPPPDLAAANNGAEEQEFYGTVETRVTLPEEGVWYIKWYATLSIDGYSKVNTPRSYETMVDLTSPRTQKRIAEIADLSELAKSRASDIHSVLRAVRPKAGEAFHSHNHAEIESRYWRLHSVLARARSTENRLVNQLQADEKVAPGLTALRAALDLAMPIKKEMQAQLDKHVKSTELRRFKDKVAHYIEAGKAANWIGHVTEKQLSALGGDAAPNRLYQLLVEGKGKQFALELDSAILEAAADRTDLFTTKQCETLRKRVAEAEEAARVESERIKEAKKEAERMEQERKEAEEQAKKAKAFREAELRAFRASAERLRQSTNNGNAYTAEDVNPTAANNQELLFAPGTTVLIHSLHSMQVLNGTTGTVEGTKGDRYVVLCHADYTLRSLTAACITSMSSSSSSEGNNETNNSNNTNTSNTKKHDVVNNDGTVDNLAGKGGNMSWTCHMCTYLHEGSNDSKSVKCQMCDTPRQHQRQMDNSNKAKKGAPAPAPAPAPPQSRSDAGSFPSLPAATSTAPKNKKKIVNAATKSRTEPLPLPSPPKSRPSQQRPSPPAVAAPAPAPAPTKTSPTKAQQQQQQHKQQQKKNWPCRDGPRCRFLPHNCRFYHEPREIEAAQARRPNYVSRKAKISPDVVGTVIGWGGTNVEMVKRNSKAKVWIDQDSMGPNEMRIVSVSGTPEAVQKGLELVRELTLEAPMGDRHSFVLIDTDDHLGGAAATTAGGGSSSPQPAPAQTHASTTTNRPTTTVSGSSRISGKAAQPPAPAPAPAVKVVQDVAAPSAAAPTAVAPKVVIETPKSPMQQQQQQQQQQQVPVPVAGNHLHFSSSVGGSPLPLGMQNSNVHHGGLQSNPVSPEKGPPSDLQQLNATSSLAGSPTDGAVEPQPVRVTPPISPPASSAGNNHEQQKSLLTFLEVNKACLKGTPEDFCRWLIESEDIATLADLAESVSDDDYLHEVLQPGNGNVGVKGFKRAAFKKAVMLTCANTPTPTSEPTPTYAKNDMERGADEVPSELTCPISCDLMTEDPVIASDGHTYERASIEEWFNKQKREVASAAQELQIDPNSQRAKAILERGVLSPVTHTKMANLNLIPNHNLRTMARDWYDASSSVDVHA